jgi:hypothetical protein
LEDEEDSEEREFRAWKKKREEDLKEEWRRSKIKKAQPPEEVEESSSCIEFEIPIFNPVNPSQNQASGIHSTPQDRPLIPQQSLGGVLNNQLQIFTSEEKNIKD